MSINVILHFSYFAARFATSVIAMKRQQGAIISDTLLNSVIVHTVEIAHIS